MEIEEKKKGNLCLSESILRKVYQPSRTHGNSWGLSLNSRFGLTLKGRDNYISPSRGRLYSLL